MNELRWEKQNGSPSEWAYSGSLVIGMVGLRDEDPKRWWYTANNAVFMKYIAKGSGETAQRSTAKKAVERAWNAWLSEAGLA